eukprot:TRINITY_DN6300_c0_g1_i1.p1 TRINITY_DN6300_c0_g1~~TRINITY_DN6300_c0_g1_i1.p1  ORF type:complete len:368 (-),score=40.64 TRINITY_DN6300_c0_g1_i1:18-1088(-)
MSSPRHGNRRFRKVRLACLLSERWPSSPTDMGFPRQGWHAKKLKLAPQGDNKVRSLSGFGGWSSIDDAVADEIASLSQRNIQLQKELAGALVVGQQWRQYAEALEKELNSILSGIREQKQTIQHTREQNSWQIVHSKTMKNLHALETGNEATTILPCAGRKSILHLPEDGILNDSDTNYDSNIPDLQVLAHVSKITEANFIGKASSTLCFLQTIDEVLPYAQSVLTLEKMEDCPSTTRGDAVQEKKILTVSSSDSSSEYSGNGPCIPIKEQQDLTQCSHLFSEPDINKDDSVTGLCQVAAAARGGAASLPGTDDVLPPCCHLCLSGDHQRPAVRLLQRLALARKSRSCTSLTAFSG